MPTTFGRIAAAASRTVDCVFGETFTIKARAVRGDGDVNARRIVDVARPDQVVFGCFSDPAAAQSVEARLSADSTTVERITSSPVLSVETSRLAWSPRDGDVVVRHEDGAAYMVTKPHSDGFGRTILPLTAKAAP